MSEDKYTQRQWDRTVGYGKVPDEYSIELKQEKKHLSFLIFIPNIQFIS